MLELQSICKRLGAFTLENLTLKIPENQYVVLLGPSGSGKTVLLEIIAGLLHPDRGTILLSGKDITSLPPEKRRLAMVMQDYALFPHLTVFQNLLFGLHSDKNPRAEKTKKVHSILGLLGIEHLLTRDVRSLSGGEQQRVALGRGLITEPSLLLLDEPLSAIDASTRVRLRSELKRIQQHTKTSFLHVTHDADEAYSLADRVGLLLDNKLLLAGSPKEMFRNPGSLTIARFLQLKNIFSVLPLENGRFSLRKISIQGPSDLPSSSQIWIRPDEIQVSVESPLSDFCNRFTGRVIAWEYQRSFVDLSLEVLGTIFTARLCHQAFDRLSIQTGKTVFLGFDSSTVHPLVD